MTTLLALIIFSFVIPLTFTGTHFTSATTAATKRRHLPIKLIHRDSYLIRNNSEPSEARAKSTLNTSMARFNYLSQIASITTTPDVQAPLYPGASSSLFYVSFSIGHPPIPQLAIMDTGSSLVWVICQSFDGQYNATPTIFDPVSFDGQRNPLKIFDPSKSSTYGELPCDNSSLCINKCNLTPHKCEYEIRYTYGPDSSGTIATERFSFETADKGEVLVNDVTFGCSEVNKDIGLEKNFRGVFGIGTEYPTLSIVQKFGSRFSYCISNIHDIDYPYNMLILGEGTILEGDPTPFDVINGVYYVTLEGISISEKRLNIDPNTFKGSGGWVEDGVMIDSSTPLTFLPWSAFRAVRQEIEDISEGLLKRTRSKENQEWLLCFSGKVSQDLKGFPAMTFHFAGGAELVIDAETMFYQTSDSVFCLAVAPSYYTGDEEMTIIGMIAQQNYNVAFDLVENQLYFQRIDCELLID